MVAIQFAQPFAYIDHLCDAERVGDRPTNFIVRYCV